MPSGRGAMEQPNITSGGAGVLTPPFWVMVIACGIPAGLLGALMMLILFNVQYTAFGYREGSLEHGVRLKTRALTRPRPALLAHPSWLRRPAALPASGPSASPVCPAAQVPRAAWRPVDLKCAKSGYMHESRERPS